MAKSGHNGNGRGHVTETPDVSHIKNVDVTHEVSDVSVGGILKFVVSLTVLNVGVFVLMLLLFNFLSAREDKKEPPPGPMALTEQERLPPEPRLQAAPVNFENGQWVSLENGEPQAEFRIMREQWDKTLREGSKDPSGSVTAIPIEKAMEKVLEGKGLLSRSAENASGSIYDYGVNPPTAASSGRTTEKIKP